MILFNDIALEQVAPVKVVDIRVSPIEMTPIARQRAVEWGADFVRMHGGSRTVSIEFAILTENRDERADQLQAVTRWARSVAPGRLVIPNRRNVYLECACTSLPEPSFRQWWESKLRVVFTTFDNPYFTSVAQKSAACGTEFVVLGDAKPLMQIERTLSAISQMQTYECDGRSMTFTQIPAGDMVIDLNRQTAAVNGSSFMHRFVFGSQFPIPRTGAMTITGTGTVKWRERWE